MKKVILAAAALLFAYTSSSHASLIYDANVTNEVIFGSGIANGALTLDRANGVELGLRAKLRFDQNGQPQNVFNSDGTGNYLFAAGVAPTQAFPVALWSFEWSIKSNFDGSNGNSVLNAFTYLLSVDIDPSAATQFFGIDVINGFNPNPQVNAVFWDHAFGNNATGNGAGVSATDPASYAALIGSQNIAQNSQQAHWWLGPTFNPTANATYTFMLSAFSGSTQVASTSINVVVGNGGTVAVSEPSLLVLTLTSLVLLGLRRRRTY